MVRKLVTIAALIVAGLVFAFAPAAYAGEGPSDYAGCVVRTSPTTFDAGDTVHVTGTGFQPNFTTDIIFTSDPVVLATVTTSATGNFATDVEIPADATDGPHTISAACDSSGAHVGSSDVAVGSGETPRGPGTTPVTGTDVAPYLAVAAIALVSGTALVVGTRRRRQSAATS
jgi:LPXTG-motif cell wall-anchored protein